MPLSKPKIALDTSNEPYHQMVLQLDLLDDPAVSDQLSGVSLEEARVRSEAGRAALQMLKGAPEQPAWFERFESLIAGGWPWRQACYIAWASMPKEDRTPDTQEALAIKHLQLNSDRAISTWRNKNPAIDTMIALMQSYELWDSRADSFKNLIQGMKRAGTDYKYFNHLKLYMEMTGDYVPMNQIAAVLKRKASAGPHQVDEETLEMLSKGAEELKRLTNDRSEENAS